MDRGILSPVDRVHPLRRRKTMMRALAFTTFVLAAFATLGTGCASEDYFCDDTGCYSCDGLGCRPVDPPPRTPCAGDYECPEGTTCTDIGCIGGCASDEECALGTECRDGACVAPTEPDPTPTPGVCETNEDCLASGLVCLDGLCTADPGVCSDDADCGAGEVCLAGECLADDDVCQFNHECGEGRVCINSRCGVGCGLTDGPGGGACPAGLVCMDGICSDDGSTSSCTTNADCSGGEVCLDGACRPECSADSDCADGYRCNSSGVCRLNTRPTPFCSSDSDCMTGRVCVDAVCRTPCADSDECLRFDVQFNVCLENLCVTTNEATSDCTTGDDCLAGQVCSDGICR